MGKIENAARALGREPQEHVDLIAGRDEGALEGTQNRI